nr:hypothetical protein [Candidatus Freyarchaeota archaeon]
MLDFLLAYLLEDFRVHDQSHDETLPKQGFGNMRRRRNRIIIDPK